MPIGEQDVYASTAGGVKLNEPGLDLGVCLAVVSAITDRPLPADMAVFGEVGLGGELRQVAHAARRITEAGRLGFGRVILPTNSPDGDGSVRTLRAGTLAEAIALAGLNSLTPQLPHGNPSPVAEREPVESVHAVPIRRRQRAHARRARPCLARNAAARRDRSGRAGQGRCAARAERRRRRVVDLLGRLPRRRARTARSDSPSWRRWTARSSSPPTAAASPAPTSTSCPTRRCRPARPAPVTARPSVSPGRSACPSCRRARRWASSTSTPAAASVCCRRSAICSTGRTRRCRRSSGTRPVSTTPSPTSPPSRSKTSPACATSSPSCSAARWCTASPTRSRR